MSLVSIIQSVQDRIKKAQFTNEASVSQGIVLPILNELDWPVFDTSVVYPEFPLEGRRIDYALCNPNGKPLVFVEVKKIGLAEGADKQLFEYAFHKGVPLAILSDGIEWHFYLPSGEGDYQERRIFKLDIIEREINDSEYYLNRYLNYGRVKTGRAIDSAKKDYENISQKRKVKEALPNAWVRLIEERDEILLELLSEKVEDLCGYKPDPDLCAEFIITQVQTKTVSMPQTKPVKTTRSISAEKKQEPNFTKKTDLTKKTYALPQIANESLGGSKPKSLIIENNKIEVRNWSDLSIKFVSWLMKNNYLEINKLPIYNAAKRDKYFINVKPEHENPEKDAAWKEVGGFYIDVKYSTKMHIKNIISTLEQLNIENLKIEISF